MSIEIFLIPVLSSDASKLLLFEYLRLVTSFCPFRIPLFFVIQISVALFFLVNSVVGFYRLLQLVLILMTGEIRCLSRMEKSVRKPLTVPARRKCVPDALARCVGKLITKD
jgi:hypothetical protein